MSPKSQFIFKLTQLLKKNVCDLLFVCLGFWRMAFGRGLLFVWIGIELISSVYLAIRLVSKVVIIYNPTPNTSESKRKRRPIIIKWDNRRKPWLPVCVWSEYFIGGAVFILHHIKKCMMSRYLIFSENKNNQLQHWKGSIEKFHWKVSHQILPKSLSIY